MKTSIRGLRSAMKRVLYAVQHGEEVVIYSRQHPIAKIIPFKKSVKDDENDGFGMWKDRSEMQDVAGYVRRIRKGRRHAI